MLLAPDGGGSGDKKKKKKKSSPNPLIPGSSGAQPGGNDSAGIPWPTKPKKTRPSHNIPIPKDNPAYIKPRNSPAAPKPFWMPSLNPPKPKQPTNYLIPGMGLPENDDTIADPLGGKAREFEPLKATTDLSEWLEKQSQAKPGQEPVFPVEEMMIDPEKKPGQKEWWWDKEIIEDRLADKDGTEYLYALNQILDKQLYDKNQYLANQVFDQTQDIKSVLWDARQAANKGDKNYLENYKKKHPEFTLNPSTFEQNFGDSPEELLKNWEKEKHKYSSSERKYRESILMNRVDYLTRARDTYDKNQKYVDKYIKEYEDAGLALPKYKRSKDQQNYDKIAGEQDRSVGGRASEYKKLKKELGLKQIPTAREMLAAAARGGQLDINDEAAVADWYKRFQDPFNPQTRAYLAAYAQRDNDKYDSKAAEKVISRPIEEYYNNTKAREQEAKDALYDAADESPFEDGNWKDPEYYKNVGKMVLMDFMDDVATPIAAVADDAKAALESGEDPKTWEEDVHYWDENYEESGEKAEAENAVMWTLDKVSRPLYAVAGAAKEWYSLDEEAGDNHVAWTENDGFWDGLVQSFQKVTDPLQVVLGKSAWDSVDDVDIEGLKQVGDAAYQQFFRGNETLPGIDKNTVPTMFAEVIAANALMDTEKNVYDKEWYQHTAGFALDMVADPLNFIGIGLVDDVLKVPARLMKKAAEPAVDGTIKALKLGDLNEMIKRAGDGQSTPVAKVATTRDILRDLEDDPSINDAYRVADEGTDPVAVGTKAVDVDEGARLADEVNSSKDIASEDLVKAARGVSEALGTARVSTARASDLARDLKSLEVEQAAVAKQVGVEHFTDEIARISAEKAGLPPVVNNDLVTLRMVNNTAPTDKGGTAVRWRDENGVKFTIPGGAFWRYRTRIDDLIRAKAPEGGNPYVDLIPNPRVETSGSVRARELLMERDSLTQSGFGGSGAAPEGLDALMTTPEAREMGVSAGHGAAAEARIKQIDEELVALKSPNEFSRQPEVVENINYEKAIEDGILDDFVNMYGKTGWSPSKELAKQLKWSHEDFLRVFSEEDVARAFLMGRDSLIAKGDRVADEMYHEASNRIRDGRARIDAIMKDKRHTADQKKAQIQRAKRAVEIGYQQQNALVVGAALQYLEDLRALRLRAKSPERQRVNHLQRLAADVERNIKNINQHYSEVAPEQFEESYQAFQLHDLNTSEMRGVEDVLAAMPDGVGDHRAYLMGALDVIQDRLTTAREELEAAAALRLHYRASDYLRPYKGSAFMRGDQINYDAIESALYTNADGSIGYNLPKKPEGDADKLAQWHRDAQFLAIVRDTLTWKTQNTYRSMADAEWRAANGIDPKKKIVEPYSKSLERADKLNPKPTGMGLLRELSEKGQAGHAMKRALDRTKDTSAASRGTEGKGLLDFDYQDRISESAFEQLRERALDHGLDESTAKQFIQDFIDASQGRRKSVPRLDEYGVKVEKPSERAQGATLSSDRYTLDQAKQKFAETGGGKYSQSFKGWSENKKSAWQRKAKQLNEALKQPTLTQQQIRQLRAEKIRHDRVKPYQSKLAEDYAKEFEDSFKRYHREINTITEVAPKKTAKPDAGEAAAPVGKSFSSRVLEDYFNDPDAELPKFDAAQYGIDAKTLRNWKQFTQRKRMEWAAGRGKRADALRFGVDREFQTKEQWEYNKTPKEQSTLQTRAYDAAIDDFFKDLKANQRVEKNPMNQRLSMMTLDEQAKVLKRQAELEFQHQRSVLEYEKFIAQNGDRIVELNLKQKALENRRREFLKEADQALVDARRATVELKIRMAEERILQVHNMPESLTTKALQVRIAGMRLNIAKPDTLFNGMAMAEKLMPAKVFRTFRDNFVRPSDNLNYEELRLMRAKHESLAPVVIHAHLQRITESMKNMTEAKRKLVAREYMISGKYLTEDALDAHLAARNIKREEYDAVAEEFKNIEDIFNGVHPSYKFQSRKPGAAPFGLNAWEINRFLPDEFKIDPKILYKTAYSEERSLLGKEGITVQDIMESRNLTTRRHKGKVSEAAEKAIGRRKLDVDDPFHFAWTMNLAIDQAYQRASLFQTIGKTFGVERNVAVGGTKNFRSSDARARQVEQLRTKYGWREVATPDDKNSPLAGYYFPPELARDIETLNKMLEPNFKTDVGQFFDEVMGYWKQLNTIYNPGYYTRNGIGEAMVSWLDGLNHPKYYRMASQMLKYMKPQNHDLAELVDKFSILKDKVPLDQVSGGKHLLTLKGGHKINVEEAIQLYIEHGLMSTFVNTDLQGGVRSLAAVGDAGKIKGIPARVNAKIHSLGENFEDYFRMAHFLYAMEDSGIGDVQRAALHARKRVIRSHFDYSDFSKVDKAVTLRLFPFYKWVRRGAPLMVEHLFLTPGKVTAVAKANDALSGLMMNMTNPEDDPVLSSQDVYEDKNGLLPDYQGIAPAWVRDLMAYQMSPAGDDEYANYLRVATPQLDGLSALASLIPGTEANSGEDAKGYLGDSQLGTLLNPFLKMGVELGSEFTEQGQETDGFGVGMDPDFPFGVIGSEYSASKGMSPVEDSVVYALKNLSPVTGFLGKLYKNGDIPGINDIGNEERGPDGRHAKWDILSFLSGMGVYQGKADLDPTNPEANQPFSAPEVPKLFEPTDAGQTDEFMDKLESEAPPWSGWKNYGSGRGWINYGNGGYSRWGYGGYGGGGSGSASGGDISGDFWDFLMRLVEQTDQGDVLDD